VATEQQARGSAQRQRSFASTGRAGSGDADQPTLSRRWSQAEVTEADFDRFDHDGDGFITFEELETQFQQGLGARPTHSLARSPVSHAASSSRVPASPSSAVAPFGGSILGSILSGQQGLSTLLLGDSDPDARLPLENRWQILEDGSEYTGQWRGQRRHGQGRLVTPDGESYEGQWAKDVAHGHGKYVFFDGATYSGEFLKGLQSGKGLEVWADNSRYDGEFREGHKNGAGIWRSAAGDMFKGNFQNDLMHGDGEYKFADGRLYRGLWKEGHMCGHGVMEWLAGSDPELEGDVFTGQWEDDMANGYGKYVHRDGSTYQGEWSKDEKSGKGFEIWVDGSRYDGDFLHGAMHGSGIWKSQTSEYRGEFRQDEYEGWGRYIFSDGRLYAGQWRRGHMTGQGEMDWPNAAKYVGGYLQDRQHGDGTYTYPDGQVYSGQWKTGKQHGTGVLKDAMGSNRPVRFKEGREIPPGRFGLGFARPQLLRSERPPPLSEGELSPSHVHMDVVPSPVFAGEGAKTPSLVSDYQGGRGARLRTAISSLFGRHGREPTYIAHMSSPRQGVHVSL